jgi:hypothetical protein
VAIVARGVEALGESCNLVDAIDRVDAMWTPFCRVAQAG